MPAYNITLIMHNYLQHYIVDAYTSHATTNQPYSGYSYTTMYSCPQNAKGGEIGKFGLSICKLTRHAVQIKQLGLRPKQKVYMHTR